LNFSSGTRAAVLTSASEHGLNSSSPAPPDSNIDPLVEKFGDLFSGMDPQERTKFREKLQREKEKKDQAGALLTQLRASGVEVMMAWKKMLKAGHVIGKS
jgi:hypothetical protein